MNPYRQLLLAGLFSSALSAPIIGSSAHAETNTDEPAVYQTAAASPDAPATVVGCFNTALEADTFARQYRQSHPYSHIEVRPLLGQYWVWAN